MTDERDDEGLSVYEHRFVEAYMGEAKGVGSVAVQMIGDATPRSAASIACELLQRPHVRKALRARMENDPLIAGRLERLRFLTRVLRGEEREVRTVFTRKDKKGTVRTVKVETPPNISDRMAAAQALAKAAGEHLAPLEDGKDDQDLTRLTIQQLLGLAAKGTMQ